MAAGEARWFSRNPSKAWGERFFLAYSPVWMLGMGVLILALAVGCYTEHQRAEAWQAKHDKALSDCNARTEAANNKALADAAERARVANEVARDTTTKAEVKIVEGSKTTTKRRVAIRHETPKSVPASCLELPAGVRAALDQAVAEANAPLRSMRAAPDG